MYTFAYHHAMRIETLSVREAREQLPSLLDRFRKGDRTPVGVGSHRRTEAVMVAVAVYDELTSERSRAAAESAGSLRAEGLAASDAVEAITARWTQGEISTDQMRAMVRQLYGVA
jgi:antitoxin (DNA-binding transcriptional repressor) of toxin-antitoxin stability system